METKNRLKELRKASNFSQKDFFEIIVKTKLKLDVTLRTYQNWENPNNEIKSRPAQALADYFGVSVGYLLGYNEGHRRVYELLGEHPKKDSMGIISIKELLEAQELGYIKDKKILGELQTDTSVAIKFLESIQSKLLLFGDISKTHTKKLEGITNFLVDFYETLERRQNTLEQTNNNND